jgi:hypothetical protein
MVVSCITIMVTEHFLDTARAGINAQQSVERHAIWSLAALFSIWVAVASGSLAATILYTGLFMTVLVIADWICNQADYKFLNEYQTGPCAMAT